MREVIVSILAAYLVFGAASGLRAKESGSIPVIHYVPGGRAERIIWVMEELKLPYKLVSEKGDVWDTLDATSGVDPMKMSPAVQIDGKILMETGLAAEYVIEKYGKGRLTLPRTSPNYWTYRLYMEYADGSAVPRIMADYVSTKIGKMTNTASTVPGGMQRVLKFVEAEVKDRAYLGGSDFTAADIMISYPLKLAREAIGDFHEYPAVDAYYKRITARDAYKRALVAAARGE